MYAIFDIETTGGQYGYERITEIAIYRYDGHQILDKFVSLLNPERSIDPFVSQLTGITDSMVKRAPKFHEVAKRIVEITKTCILVAHNVDFDYRVLHQEFKKLGFHYHRNTLCSVQLSRILLPDLPSYRLGKLCKSVGIPIANRHRADGDAFAIVNLFELLLQKDKKKNIVSQNIHTTSAVLKKEKLISVIRDIPSVTGVFYVHQDNGRIIYIGKGKNIRNKLQQLFAKKSKKALKIQSKLVSVSYDESGSYVMARLLFNQEVATHKPRYNSNYFTTVKPVEFSHPNMLLIDRGRRTGEKSVIFVEDGKLSGFAYVDLAHQITNLDILKNILTPLSDSLDNRYIIKTSLQNKKIQEIINL